MSFIARYIRHHYLSTLHPYKMLYFGILFCYYRAGGYIAHNMTPHIGSTSKLSPLIWRELLRLMPLSSATTA